MKNDDPWTWKKLLKLRNNMYEYINTLVGDGRDTMLFYDNWLPVGNLAKFMDDVHVWGENMKVEQGWHVTRGWIIPTSFKRKYPQLTSEIKKIQLTVSKDKVIWKPATNGQFNINQFYNMLRRTVPKVSWHRLV